MDKGALQTLISLTHGSVNSEVRMEAVKALGQYRDDAEVAGALAGLTHGSVKHEIRIAAVKALGGEFDPDRFD